MVTYTHTHTGVLNPRGPVGLGLCKENTHTLKTHQLTHINSVNETITKVVALN